MGLRTRPSARAAGTPRQWNARRGIALIPFVLLLLGGLSACGRPTPADTPPPQADLLSIVVTEPHSLTDLPVDRIVFSQQFTDQATITTVQRALLTIPLLTSLSSTKNCVETPPIPIPPALYGYDFRFTERGTLVEHATASVDTQHCDHWYIITRKGTDQRILASPSFWDQLHSVTGAPLPIYPQP